MCLYIQQEIEERDERGEKEEGKRKNVNTYYMFTSYVNYNSSNFKKLINIMIVWSFIANIHKYT